MSILENRKKILKLFDMRDNKNIIMLLINHFKVSKNKIKKLMN